MTSSPASSPSLTRPWKIAYAMVAFAFVGLMANVPLVFIPASPLDDALFVKAGGYIASGHWLGPYSNFTLAKGPVYPLFIALNWIVGLPILVGQAVVAAAATFCLIRGMRPWLRSEPISLFVYALLLFNPATYTVANLRVMREGIYVPLTVLLFALGLHWYRRRLRDWRARVVLALAFGLTLGAFWCVREEGPWIIPTLLAAVGATCGTEIARISGPWRARVAHARDALVREAKLIGLTAGSAVAVWLVFAMTNLAVYGVADVVDVKQREFVTAYGALARIRSEIALPNVVVSRAARTKAYAVSPAAAELRPVLDGAPASVLAGPGCTYYRIEPCDDELRTAWFIWALRHAVAEAGHYRSAPEARAFYRRLANEIDAACDAGKIDCRPSRATLAPAFTPQTVSATIRSAVALLKFMVRYDGMIVAEHPMSCVVDDCGAPLAWSQFLDMIHTTVFVMVESPPEFVRRSPAGDPSAFDLDKYMQMDRAARPLPFVYRAAIVARILNVGVGVYRNLMPLFIALGVAAYVALAVFALIKRRMPALLAVASFAAAVVLSRIALLAYLDATAVPSINPLYLSPAYPLALLFGATAIVGLVTAIGDARRR